MDEPKVIEQIAAEVALAVAVAVTVTEPAAAEIAVTEPAAEDPLAVEALAEVAQIPAEAKVIEPVRIAPEPTAEPLSISVAVSQAAPIARAAIADPVGMRIAGQLSEPLKTIYGERLRGFYLYGLRAAGPAPADAEVETLIVLDRVDGYGTELERTSHIYAALSHDLKVVVSRVFVEEATWDGGPDGVIPTVRSEAVAV